MTRSWRLTPRAENALVEIALWTIDRFGPEQAERYEAEILARCDMLARDDITGQDCSALAEAGEGLRFIRAGRHFVIYVEFAAEIVVIDVVHGRVDLPRHLQALRPPATP